MRHASNFSSFIIAAFVSLALVACEKKTDSPRAAEPPKTPAAAAQESMHAPAGARPGSCEDWCGEHQVPESQCTRCNPSLITAFKATGDWCEEHKLPESQCFACNPELKIERPPRTKGNEP